MLPICTKARGLYQSISNETVAMSSRDSDSSWLSCHHLLVTSPLEAEPQNPSPVCDVNLIAWILHRSCADNHHFCDFMYAVVTGMVFHPSENTQHTDWNLVSVPALLCFFSSIFYTYVGLFI